MTEAEIRTLLAGSMLYWPTTVQPWVDMTHDLLAALDEARELLRWCYAIIAGEYGNEDDPEMRRIAELTATLAANEQEG